MKPLKKYLLLNLIGPLLFSLLSFKSLAGNSEVLVIKIYEGLVSEPRITISSEEKTTVLNLEKPKTTAAIDKNSEVVAKILKQYLNEGYKIESSNAVLHSTYSSQITTYILTK